MSGVSTHCIVSDNPRKEIVFLPILVQVARFLKALMKIENDQIIVGDITIDVIKKDIKNLRLRFYHPTGKVRIAAPLKINDDTIRSFCISKLGWIKKQQLKRDGREDQSRSEFVSGEGHYFFGKRHLLTVFTRNAAPRAELHGDTCIYLHVRPGSTLEQREKVMTKWYRLKLQESIPPLIEKWQSVTGVSADNWRIKKMKTRWGTCNRKARRIWLNLELAKRPMDCLEFIIVHELTHLIERRHNDRFKAYMDHFMPLWRVYRDELDNVSIPV
ncbi:MAG: SprT family zinc-dependent metalloprotease [Desulfomonilaceae bacterium]